MLRTEPCHSGYGVNRVRKHFRVLNRPPPSRSGLYSIRHIVKNRDKKSPERQRGGNRSPDREGGGINVRPAWRTATSGGSQKRN